jgi:hypothetical protein
MYRERMKFGRRRTLLLLICVSVALSACQDFSSPDEVIGSAYSQLNEDNLKGFQQDLSGSALTTYGTAHAMTSLRAKLDAQQFTLTADQLIGHGKHTAIYQVATVPSLLTFTVICAETVTNSCPELNDRCPPVVSTHCSISEVLTESQLARSSARVIQ